MFLNYLKIALRQLRRQKLYALVKVGGFALGIAVCVLIALYIRYESNYDDQYPDGDRIYRIVGLFEHDGKIEKSTYVPAPMSTVLKSDFPEVERSGRWLAIPLFEGAGSNEFRPADAAQNTYEQGFAYADQETVNILQLPMVYGTGTSALTEPQTMLISKRKADQFFPGINPIGKLVYLNNQRQKPYKISGVISDIPQNSHLHNTDFILSLAGHELWNGEQTDWGAWNYTAYVQLRKDVDAGTFGKKLTASMMDRYFLPFMIKAGDVDAKKKAGEFHLLLQPVKTIHLRSYDIEDGLTHGDIRFVRLFGAIALFILVIACINFINLSTARSANRAREVGLRKVVGSARGSLIAQFLMESVIFSLLSFALGLFLAEVLLPYFNIIAGHAFSMPWEEWWLMPLMLLAALVIGVLAGIYPAFFLSGFRPVQVLKGAFGRGGKHSLLRNVLVVFQFAASVVLIIGTIVIYRQMQFILNRDAGFNRDQVVMIEGVNALQGAEIRAFKTELSKLSSVTGVTVSDFLPVEGTKRNGNTFFNEGRQRQEAGVSVQIFQVDEDYLKTLGIKLAGGRNFSQAMATDSASVLINETMARQLRLADPVGHRITSDGHTYTVIGVVKDFNYESMRSNIDPLVMRLGFSPSIVSVKIGARDLQKTLSAIKGVWKSFSPSQAIRYTFLDEQFEVMYADVLRTGRLFTCFAVLAVIIACLGLFGLSAFMAEQRRKEIGIRKVLGATVAGITALLSYDFVKLVLLSILIAAPLGWWAMHTWLENFAYRITISWWIFVAAGLSAILIAVCTVSLQSLKAALANPARTLKNE